MLTIIISVTSLCSISSMHLLKMCHSLRDVGENVYWQQPRYLPRMDANTLDVPQIAEIEELQPDFDSIYDVKIVPKYN